MKKTNELNVKGTPVRVVKIDGEDFVCLTDMAKLKSDDAQQTISNWMRNRMTIEYLGLWEYLYNPSFKPLEFEGFRVDVLNVALFGQTHQQWQAQHPELKGNQRDYADINQLICISNMENLNAVMIEDGIPQPQRLKRLNEIAIHQMKILSAGSNGRNLLK